MSSKPNGSKNKVAVLTMASQLLGVALVILPLLGGLVYLILNRPVCPPAVGEQIKEMITAQSSLLSHLDREIATFENPTAANCKFLPDETVKTIKTALVRVEVKNKNELKTATGFLVSSNRVLTSGDIFDGLAPGTVVKVQQGDQWFEDIPIANIDHAEGQLLALLNIQHIGSSLPFAAPMPAPGRLHRLEYQEGQEPLYVSGSLIMDKPSFSKTAPGVNFFLHSALFDDEKTSAGGLITDDHGYIVGINLPLKVYQKQQALNVAILASDIQNFLQENEPEAQK
jgi:hypothetical protein